MASEALKITEAALKRIQAEAKNLKAGQRIEYRDSEILGLRLRVSSQSMVWTFYKRINGRQSRITIGTGEALSPADARKAAKALAGQIAVGKDVVMEKRQAKAAGITLAEALARFERDKGGKLRPDTLKQYRAEIERHLSDWLDKPVSKLTRQAVLERHNKLSAKKPTTADRLMRELRAVLNHARELLHDEAGEPLLPEAPTRVLAMTKAWNGNKAKTRSIPFDKIGDWLEAVESDVQLWQGYFWTAILLGLRRTELSTLAWNNVDFHRKVLPNSATDLRWARKNLAG